METKVLFAGVDTLDVTFQGRLPKETCDMLLAVKEKAQENHGPVFVEFGPGKVKCHVFGSSPEGTKLQIDTGEDAEKWFIAVSQDMTQWNIRCSVRAEALRDYGYQTVRDRLYQRLNDMGAKVIGESIGRVDFAIDFLTDNEFRPDPGLFICHHHTRVHAWDDEPKDSKKFDVFWYNHKPNSVAVGSKKYRQVAIYNKRREVLHSSKKMGWFETWGINSKDTDKQVWRVEVRCAKDYLHRFGIKTFDDLDNSMADVFLHALDAVRYRDEGQTDTNVTRQRLHPLWIAAREQIETDLFYARSGLVPSNIKNVRRTELLENAATQLRGIAVTMAFAKGCFDPRSIPRLVNEMMAAFDRQNPRVFEKKLIGVGERYHFIKEPDRVYAQPS